MKAPQQVLRRSKTVLTAAAPIVDRPKLLCHRGRGICNGFFIERAADQLHFGTASAYRDRRHAAERKPRLTDFAAVERQQTGTANR
jgi:hypothetical protein